MQNLLDLKQRQAHVRRARFCVNFKGTVKMDPDSRSFRPLSAALSG